MLCARTLGTCPLHLILGRPAKFLKEHGEFPRQMPKVLLQFLLPCLSILLCATGSALAASDPQATLRAEIATLRQTLAEKEAQLLSLAPNEGLPQATLSTESQAMALATEGTPLQAPLRVAPSSTLGWEKALKAAGAARYMVPGASLMAVMPTGSMKPVFDERAILLMEPANFDDLKVGDIVTYIHPAHKAPVVHRLTEKRGEQFWSKGDNNGRRDEVCITRQNFRARVFGIIYAKDSGQ